MSQKVSVIDYGIGNLLNVVRAFEHCGADVEVVNSAGEIKKSGHLILPGVGAFPDGMSELQRRDLIEPILQHTRDGKPLLGICLGMQMLFDRSEEFGGENGLSIIAGKVVAIPGKGLDGKRHKIPHIGWNELLSPEESSWSGSILQNIKKDSAAYFVHSFMAKPALERDCLSFCEYGGIQVSAVVQHENSIGCQFHPEKSGEVGLQIIRDFLSVL